MELSIDEVRRIAHLARLRLSPEEEQTFCAQLGQIIDYFDQLSEYSSGAIEDRSVSETLERDDIHRVSMPQEKMLDAMEPVFGIFDGHTPYEPMHFVAFFQ